MAPRQLSILLLSALFLVQLAYQPASATIWPKVVFGSGEEGVVITLPKALKPFDLKEIFAEEKEDFESKIAQFFEDDEKKLKIFGKLFKLDEKKVEQVLEKEDNLLPKADKPVLCKKNYPAEIEEPKPCAYEEQDYNQPQPVVYKEQQQPPQPSKVYYEPPQEYLPCCEDEFYS